MRAGIASHNAASSQQSAPVTLGGVAKSYGSGALGALIGLSHHVNPLDPHGWADNAELATTMGAWALKRAGIITPQQMTGAINAEHDFRRRIPLHLADTSEEQQRASGYYHDPRNRAEEIANIAGGATVAAIGGPETLAANAARTALRTGAQVVFKTAARQTARVARQVAAQTALQEAARVVVQRAGGDAYDQQAATMAAGFVPTSRKASAAPTPEPQPARAPTATRGQVSPTILQTAAPGAPPTPQARPVLGPASNVRRPPSELTRLGPATVLATARERPSSLATTASGFDAYSAPVDARIAASSQQTPRDIQPGPSGGGAQQAAPIDTIRAAPGYDDFGAPASSITIRESDVPWQRAVANGAGEIRQSKGTAPAPGAPNDQTGGFDEFSDPLVEAPPTGGAAPEAAPTAIPPSTYPVAEEEQRRSRDWSICSGRRHIRHEWRH